NYRMQHLASWIVQFSTQEQAKLLKDGKWNFPESWLTDLTKRQNWGAFLVDGWGGPIKLVKREQKQDNVNPQFHFHDLVSCGPDGKLGTPDDFRFGDAVKWKYAQDQWGRWGGFGRGGRGDERLRLLGAFDRGEVLPLGMPGGVGGGGPPRAAMPVPEAKTGA